MTPLDSLHPDALLKDARTPHHRCVHQTTAVVGISATSPFILLPQDRYRETAVLRKDRAAVLENRDCLCVRTPVREPA
jgi:hypothetical protein